MVYSIIFSGAVFLSWLILCVLFKNSSYGLPYSDDYTHLRTVALLTGKGLSETLSYYLPLKREVLDPFLFRPFANVLHALTDRLFLSSLELRGKISLLLHALSVVAMCDLVRKNSSLWMALFLFPILLMASYGVSIFLWAHMFFYLVALVLVVVYAHVFFSDSASHAEVIFASILLVIGFLVNDLFAYSFSLITFGIWGLKRSDPSFQADSLFKLKLKWMFIAVASFHILNIVSLAKTWIRLNSIIFFGQVDTGLLSIVEKGFATTLKTFQIFCASILFPKLVRIDSIAKFVNSYSFESIHLFMSTILVSSIFLLLIFLEIRKPGKIKEKMLTIFFSTNAMAFLVFYSLLRGTQRYEGYMANGYIYYQIAFFFLPFIFLGLGRLALTNLALKRATYIAVFIYSLATGFSSFLTISDLEHRIGHSYKEVTKSLIALRNYLRNPSRCLDFESMQRDFLNGEDKYPYKYQIYYIYHRDFCSKKPATNIIKLKSDNMFDLDKEVKSLGWI